MRMWTRPGRRPDVGHATGPGPDHHPVGSLLGTVVIASLMGLTSWFVASVSAWLVPVYVTTMAVIFLAPRTDRTGRVGHLPEVDEARPEAALAPDPTLPAPKSGSQASGRVDMAPAGPAPEVPQDKDPYQEPGPQPEAQAPTKPKRTRGRARKPGKAAKSVTEPSSGPDLAAPATWIRIGPGKFVRADSRDPSPAIPETSDQPDVSPPMTPVTVDSPPLIESDSAWPSDPALLTQPSLNPESGAPPEPHPAARPINTLDLPLELIEATVEIPSHAPAPVDPAGSTASHAAPISSAEAVSQAESLGDHPPGAVEFTAAASECVGFAEEPPGSPAADDPVEVRQENPAEAPGTSPEAEEQGIAPSALAFGTIAPSPRHADGGPDEDRENSPDDTPPALAAVAAHPGIDVGEAPTPTPGEADDVAPEQMGITHDVEPKVLRTEPVAEALGPIAGHGNAGPSATRPGPMRLLPRPRSYASTPRWAQPIREGRSWRANRPRRSSRHHAGDQVTTGSPPRPRTRRACGRSAMPFHRSFRPRSPPARS